MLAARPRPASCRRLLPLLLLAAAGVHAAAPPGAPNLLLISIDTLRADHLSCYGYPRRTSPVIDALAAAGTRVTRAWSSSPWTVPSHMTMLTGLAPSVHGVDTPGRRLDPARDTLAEILQIAGWQTAAFVTGPTLHAAFGFDQGFAHYENVMAFERRDFVGGDETLPSDAVRDRAHRAVTGPTVEAAVVRWLGHAARPPFFLFVHLWDPHYDYIPPPPYDTRFDPDWRGTTDFSFVDRNRAIHRTMPAEDLRHLVALYDGEIAATDATVGAILAALAAQGLAERTLVVLTADHGEEFFEHGRKGHMKTLYEESIHVPLVFRFPGRIPPGGTLDAVVASVHLAPTILGLLGLPPRAGLLGRDLAAAVRGESPAPALPAFAELAHGRATPLYALRTGDRKVVGTLGETPSAEAFDLATDPAERRPATADPATLAAFAQGVREATAGRATAAAGPAPLDPHTRRQLEALGYLAPSE